eukprot:gene16266-22445_t
MALGRCGQAGARSKITTGNSKPSAGTEGPLLPMDTYFPGRDRQGAGNPAGSIINLAGFNFGYRNGIFDWRLLHGIDVEAVVRLTDVKAVEDSLHTLRHGSLGGEKGLSVKNCIQLFRLLQLAVEYLTHLGNAHVVLLERYEESTKAAENWKASARQYMDIGSIFMDDSMKNSFISRQQLDQVDDTRVMLEAQDQQYNDALDNLELDLIDDTRVMLEAQDQQYNDALDNLENEDQRARYFHFRKQRTELNWQQIYSIDLEELTSNVDVHTLDAVIHNLVYGSIISEDREELTPHHFDHIIPLAQCALDYRLFQANATGAMLEAAMAQLQMCCNEIPPLTTASQEMHSHITDLIMEAHGAVPGQASGSPERQPGPPNSMPGSGGRQAHAGYRLGGSTGLLPGGALRSSTASFARAGPGYTLSGTGMGAEAMLQPPRFTKSPTRRGGSPTVHHGTPGNPRYSSGTFPADRGGGYPDDGGGNSILHSTAGRRHYDELLISAMAGAAANGGAAAAATSAFEVHSHASELHYKVDALESDLR